MHCRYLLAFLCVAFASLLEAQRTPLDSVRLADTTVIHVVKLRDGKTLKVVTRDAGFPMTQPLIGVGIRLVTGQLATCSYFPIGTGIVVDEPGHFEARDGFDPGACYPSRHGRA